jgi:peptidoglycan/xylan/chitin deacetylase (PgdA/CDA1 family)
LVKNFLFHRVNPQRDALWDPMDVTLFEKCIRHITKHYQVICIEEAALTTKTDLKTRWATISFDDGYKDNLEYAAPILNKYKCPASFYVVTDCIDNNIPTWTYILDYCFQNTTHFKWDMDGLQLPLLLRKEVWINAEERINYARHLKKYVKTLNALQQKAIIERVTTSFNDIVLPQIMMNWDDVRQLANSSFVIGSHTVTHPMLGSLENEQDISYELTQSAAVIKNQTGQFPLTISYPIGSYNDTVIELSKHAGYKMGLATGQTFYEWGQDDVFKIPRTELYNESWLKTSLRINGWLEKLKNIKGSKA